MPIKFANTCVSNREERNKFPFSRSRPIAAQVQQNSCHVFNKPCTYTTIPLTRLLLLLLYSNRDASPVELPYVQDGSCLGAQPKRGPWSSTRKSRRPRAPPGLVGFAGLKSEPSAGHHRRSGADTPSRSAASLRMQTPLLSSA